jgi:hypothetical protein
MCTELILAILYFITIFAVNFFLYKLIKNYIVKILYLLKFKNIFKFFKLSKNNIFPLLYLYSKNSLQNQKILELIPNSINSKDVLLIGNLYSYLLKNIDIKISKSTTQNYYFQLLENQYLSKFIDLK